MSEGEKNERETLRRAQEWPRKPGRPHGTTKDDSKRGVVRFRCSSADKTTWVRKAQSEGKTLTRWILDKLNRL